MKILRVSLKNINSLAGSWTIDFDSPDFRSEAFVITGPTGSGKTSILDAIALAIYGRTARQSSVSNAVNAVMTDGAGECEASADFIGVDGGRYRARWEQHRARNRADGSLQQINRELLRVADASDNGVLLEKGNERAGAKIVAMAGLSYDQFVRAVILQQGDFAAFLSAKESERADLLEKAVRDTRFSEAGVKVFEKFQSATRDLHDAESVLADRIGIKSGSGRRSLAPEQIAKDVAAAAKKLDDDRRAAQDRLDGAEAESRRLEKELADLQGEISWVREDEGLAAESRELDAKRTAVEELEKEFVPARETYVRALRARESDTLYAPLVEARKGKADAERRLQSAEARKESREKDVAAREDQLRLAKDRKSTVEAACAQRRRTIDEADAIAGEIQKCKGLFDAAVESEGKTRDKADKDNRSAASAGEKAARAERLLAAAEGWASGAAVPAEFRREPIFATLEAAAAADRNIQGEEAKVRDAEQAFNEAKSIADVLRGDEAKGEGSELSILKERARKAKDAYEAVKWALDLSDQRKLLRNGDKCPLCGAEYHASNVPENLGEVVGDAQRAMEEAGTAVQAKESAQAGIRAAESRAAQELGKAQKRLDKVRKDADKATRERPIALERARSEAESWRNRAAELEKAAEASRSAAEDAASERRKLADKLAELDAAIRKLLGEASVAEARHEVEKEMARAERTVAQAEKSSAEARAALDAVEGEIVRENNAVSSFTTAIDKAESAFRCKITPDFSCEENWCAARLDEGIFAALKKRAEGIDEQRRSIDLLGKNLAARRADHDRARPAETVRPRQELEALADEKARAKADADTRKGEARKEVERLDEVALGRSDALADWNAKSDLRAKWKQLNEWFGGQDGNAFRIYAQGVTLGKLIIEANGPLMTMTGRRYELDWTGADGDLMPVAVDHWRADDRRVISNLSGGETFLVSLALALGLGRLAGKDLPIETLFLDEGFGTLDGEKLQLALQTLSELHGAGCNIGVISHVEAVQSRGFDVIRVTQQGGGVSTISGPGVSSSL